MDYRANEDYYWRNRGYSTAKGPSYNQIIDVDISEGVLAELFTVSDFKSQYGKIDDTTEDTLIGFLITAARQMCEQYTATNFITRQVTAAINNCNGGTYLPYGPIESITSIKDVDDNTLTTDEYKISGIYFKQILWPTASYLKIIYEAGYTACPENLITAVKMQTLYLYENRGDNNAGMSPDVKIILNPLIRK